MLNDLNILNGDFLNWFLNCRAKFGDVKTYNVWGLALMEVEVDMLTGMYKIVRTDIVEDAGKSISPDVSLGV